MCRCRRVAVLASWGVGGGLRSPRAACVARRAPGFSSTVITRSSAPEHPLAITTSSSVSGARPATDDHAATARRASALPALCMYPLNSHDLRARGMGE